MALRRRGGAAPQAAAAPIGPTTGRAGRRAVAAAAAPTVYKMRQQMLAIGNDFWIETEAGQRAYKFDGKALRVRETLRMEDPQGRELYKIQGRILRVRDTMVIENAQGRRVASVANALLTPLRERWSISVAGGEDMHAQGNILQHEFRIEQGRARVAEVSKKWFRVRDTYGVRCEPGQDDALLLMIAVCIDIMAHPSR
jgi:uncharacterized protein YxjI